MSPLTLGVALLVGVLAVAPAAASASRSRAAASEAAVATCAEPLVRDAVTQFVVAFNAGNRLRLDALFARPPIFRWFSSGPPGLRVRAAAYRRETLLAYFARRHAQRDRFQLVRFQFNGVSAGYGHFEFRIRRRADDFRGGRSFAVTGKGAAHCAGTRPLLAVWSLGGPESG